MSKPTEVIRFGRVTASIFINVSDGGRRFRTCSLQCRVAGKNGEAPRYLSSFSLADLPAAREVLRIAQERIAAEEAVVVLSSNEVRDDESGQNK